MPLRAKDVLELEARVLTEGVPSAESPLRTKEGAGDENPPRSVPYGTDRVYV